MVPYRAMLDIPHEIVEHVSWLIYARRRDRRSRWRRLTCFQQALLVLVHLRTNATLAELGRGFSVSTATAGRYVTETVDLLAEHAPTLRDALRKPPTEGFVILDGTLIATHRVKADESYCSQKHRRHGMNVQVIAAPDGTALWFSRALPGRTADITAARAHGVVQACLSRMVLVLADKGYQGAHGTVRTPYKGRDLPQQYRQFNRDHARLRAPGERAFARLKQWRILRKARCSTSRIGRTVAAVHAIEIAWRSG
ncbi:transposase family protein [Streptomyces sp. NPDC005202]|uniref:transposase family protein n=1 Tax=Streptomyces sp. NPDC005202 TaxID=3157021 RepID=UPI0033A44238